MKVKDILPNEKVDEILIFRSEERLKQFKTVAEIPQEMLEREVLQYWLDREDCCGIQDSFIIVLMYGSKE